MRLSTAGTIAILVFCLLLVSRALLASRAERARPIRIGALTPSWGPSPQVLELRDGLLERGYREGEHFVLGIRFTQGDLAALPAAARLVEKILNGAAPAELPVETSLKMVLAINLRVANALGLTIAPQMLYQADRLVR
jgi:ABC transporter substrate binding protein